MDASSHARLSSCDVVSEALKDGMDGCDGGKLVLAAQRGALLGNGNKCWQPAKLY